jgi:hypothetical protein
MSESDDTKDDYKKRVKYLKRFDPLEFEDTFLEVLANNPDLLRDLITAANFHANMHDIHDECPSGEQQCDNCYSGDTEAENNSNLKNALKQLWINTYDMTYVYSDGDDASEDEYQDRKKDSIKRIDSEKDYFHNDGNTEDDSEDKEEILGTVEKIEEGKETVVEKGKETVVEKGKEELNEITNSNN